MEKTRWQRIEERFAELAALAENERLAVLRTLARDEPDLYQELTRLLAADERTAGLLDAPLAIAAHDLLTDSIGIPADESAARLTPGTRLGAYEVERELGQGGMGVVYLARRADGAYEQQVALKVLRGGLAGELFAARFAQERKILARLQHPHIARLLDAGSMADGALYFVMEYVDGERIDSWLRNNAVPVRERLALFLQALDAVQYAHRNLVIHCDLKPGNILIDQDRQVRLLDFGIARLLVDPAKDQTAVESEAVALTPQYAAPEILRGEAATIASDIYSLGVVLYEILAGCKPRSNTSHERGAVVEMLAAEPVPLDRQPSLDIQLRRRLRGDLTAIVHKAMANDAALRYPTVEAMAEDIRRHRVNLPVNARPDDRGYRAAKFVRRHGFGVAASAVIALATTAGLVSTAWQSHWRGIEAQKAEEVKNFLLRLFSGVDPEQALGQEITARQLVEEGASRIEREFADQPGTRAEIVTFLADLFDKLGDQNRALIMIEEAVRTLGPQDSPALASALQVRGRIRISRGKVDDGVSDIEQALVLHHRFGADLDAAEDYDQLAIAARQRGAADEARRLTEQGLQLRLATLGRDHEETASSYNNLGVIARNAGDLAAAERYHATALEIRRKVLPAKHPGIALSLNNLGALMLSLGRYREAEDYFAQSLEQNLALYGENHPLTITARNNIGATDLRLGRFREAKIQLEAVLDYWRAHADGNHPSALLTRYNLAAVALGSGDFATAENELHELLRRWREQYGEAHYLAAAAEYSLGMVALEQGRADDAEALLVAALAHRRTALGEAHPYIADSLRSLGQLALSRGDPDAAGKWIAEALAMQEAILPPGHPSIALTRLVEARWQLDRGNAQAAVAEFEENLRALESAMARDVPELVRGRFDLARARLQLGHIAMAREELADVRDAIAARFGGDAWQTAVAECWLAETLLAGGNRKAAGSFIEHASPILAGQAANGMAEIAAARQMLAVFASAGGSS